MSEHVTPDMPAEEAREIQPGTELSASERPAEEHLERVTTEELLPDAETPQSARELEDEQLRAVLEAIIYVTEEALTLDQIVAALGQSKERVVFQLKALIAEFQKPEHGISIQEVAGGYKMATKPEHHDAVRSFVRNLKPPMKLSLPALETLAVIAYKQPITAPEVMEVRGVQGTGVLKTLLDRKLIAAAGRKNVIGKPILYKTTREFLVQFGLKDLNELPSLKEFEELRRMSVSESEPDQKEAGQGGQSVLHLEQRMGPQPEPAESNPEPPGPAENVERREGHSTEAASGDAVDGVERRPAASGSDETETGERRGSESVEGP